MKLNTIHFSIIKGLMVILIILFQVSKETPAQSEICGTKHFSAEEMLNLENSVNQWLAKGNGVTTENIITIPVAFHVIRYNDGTGDVTNQQLYTQINVLNTGFSNTNFRFSLYKIDRTNNSTWMTHSYDSPEETQMKQTLAINPRYVLNFYICALSGSFMTGYARFPSEFPEDSYMHGVVIRNTTLPGGTHPDYHYGITGVHEVGHYVGLFHTFENGCFAPGDMVSDTPDEGSPSEGCPTGKNTCGSDDPIHNYMDYSDDYCRTEFTSGQSQRMNEQMAYFRGSLYDNTLLVKVEVDQKRESGSLMSGTQVGRWTGTTFSNNTITTSEPQFDFFDGTTEVLKGKQDLATNPNEKYNSWVKNNSQGISDVRNHHSFTISSDMANLTSQFKQTYSGVTIKNEYLELPGLNPSTDNINFKDPWFIDYQDPDYGNNWRNRGMSTGNDAPMFRTRSSPFTPNFTDLYENNQKYNGVFLNQDYNISGNPYYSVSVPSPQTINLGGSLGSRNFYFFNWSATPSSDAEFQNKNDIQTGVVFKNDGITVAANLKGHLLTNSSIATSSNSQRKIVESVNDIWAMVYVSLNQVWLSRSTDGTNWGDEILLSDKNSISGYPSISMIGSRAYIVWQDVLWYGSGNPSNRVKIYMRSYDVTYNTLSSTTLIGSFTPNIQNFQANPVIDGKHFSSPSYDVIMVAWKNPFGIGVNAHDYYGWNGVATVSGTNGYSCNPTIAYSPHFTNNKFSLCWEDQYSQKIKYSEVSYYNEILSFTSPIDVSPSNWLNNSNPQITMVDEHPTVTWSSRNNIIEGGASVHIRQKVGSSWQTITSFSQSTTSTLYPAIGDYENSSNMDVAWNIGNAVYRAFYNGLIWVGPYYVTSSGGTGINIK